MTESEDSLSPAVKKYLEKIVHENILECCVYTELSAKICTKEILPVILKLQERDEAAKDEYEVSELVKKEKDLIISGESGSGKTVTLRWLIFNYAKNLLENGGDSIPLYVALNSYIEGRFDEYIRDIAKEKGLDEIEFESLLRGRVIFFIDGLDQLSPRHGFVPYEEIQRFVTKYNDCRYVISSRPGFFEGFGEQRFKVSVLEDLSDDKIGLFIDSYLKDDKKLSLILKDKILNGEKLKSLLKNPLMLYLALFVASRNRDKKDILPSRRSEMYREFINGVFEHGSKRKPGGVVLKSDRVQILETLEDIYFELQRRNQVSTDYRHALEIASRHSKDKKFRSVPAQDILQDIFDIGLLRKEGARITYGIHQSFQEYFSALSLKAWFDEGLDVSSAFAHPKWEEVVILASEIVKSLDDFLRSMMTGNQLYLASKCAQHASEKVREELCIRLADRLDGRYNVEKTSALESMGRLGDIGIGRITAALGDKNKYVRGSAAEALGKIQSERAVGVLVAALDDEDEYVRLSAKYALMIILNEICSSNHKKVLEKSSNSPNEYEANSAYEVLKEIELSERLRTEIFQEKPALEKSTTVENIFTAQSPEKGMKDPYFHISVDRLKFAKEPFVLVDYGCGQGKLFYAMNSIPASALGNISYIGVDRSSVCLLRSELTARKCGFYERLRSEPKFMRPAEFFEKGIQADGVYLLHTLHEIPLAELIGAIYGISACIKIGGTIFILDPRSYIEERNYILWDEESDFEKVFLNSGFEVYPHSITTNKGNRLNAVDVKKISESSFPKDMIAKNCLAMYESKITKLTEERRKDGISNKDRHDMNEVLGNLTSQIQEYKCRSNE